MPPNPDNVVIDHRVEGHQAAGVHAPAFARCQRHRQIVPPLCRKVNPVAFELLQDEPLPAEEAGPEPLGERDADVDLAQCAEERVVLAEDLLVTQIDRMTACMSPPISSC